MFYPVLGGPYQPKLDIWKVLEFSRMSLPPQNSLTRFQKRNFLVQKREGFRQKYPKCAPFLWRVLAVFSGFKPVELTLHHFFVSLMLQLGEKNLPQELGK